jgi:hypothetical protein
MGVRDTRVAEEEQAEGRSKAGAWGSDRKMKLMIRIDLTTYGLAGAGSVQAGVLGTNGQASRVKQAVSLGRRQGAQIGRGSGAWRI